ncbi:MAG: hypothetical protein ABMB14_10365 [Myxococcota bacterium]
MRLLTPLMTLYAGCTPCRGPIGEYCDTQDPRVCAGLHETEWIDTDTAACSARACGSILAVTDLCSPEGCRSRYYDVRLFGVRDLNGVTITSSGPGCDEHSYGNLPTVTCGEPFPCDEIALWESPFTSTTGGTGAP